MIALWVLVALIGVVVLVAGGIYGSRSSSDYDFVTPLVGVIISVVGVAIAAVAIAWRLGVWYAQV
jgi:hypothetical protein